MHPKCLFLAAAFFAVTAQATAQVFTPIAVTGYTQDVIADATGGSMATTTASLDQPAPVPGYVLCEQGFNGSTRGFSSNGSIVTSAIRAYQLGPVNGNNSLQLGDFGGTSPPPILSGTLTLDTPAPYAALSLLFADGFGRQPSQGGYPGTLAVNWSNGISTTYQYTVYDWDLASGSPGPNSGVAVTGLDRTPRETGVPQNLADSMTLFYFDIDLTSDANYQSGALIDSVTATRQSGFVGEDTTNIMGLSGATSVPEPSTLLLTATAGIIALHRRRKGVRSP
jgi:hypothetical protein